MTRHLELEDDMKEYWAFYLIQGSSVTVSTCVRYTCSLYNNNNNNNNNNKTFNGNISRAPQKKKYVEKTHFLPKCRFRPSLLGSIYLTCFSDPAAHFSELIMAARVCLSVHFHTQQHYRHNFCTHTDCEVFAETGMSNMPFRALHHSVINKTGKAVMRSCTVATTLAPFCVESDVLYGDKSIR
jgi:hypothetical protein